MHVPSDGIMGAAAAVGPGAPLAARRVRFWCSSLPGPLAPWPPGPLAPWPPGPLAPWRCIQRQPLPAPAS
jgi:hypothetical protein